MTDVFEPVVGEPASVIAGDFISWKRADLADQITAGYVLRYVARFGASGSTTVTFDAVVAGDTYLVERTGAQTAVWQAGRWYWEAFLVRPDNERVRITHGQWDVGLNLAGSTVDPRSHAEVMLKKIESVLEGRADSDVENYSIASRSITKMSVEELLSWRNYYRTEVGVEENARLRKMGRPSRNTIQVRFVE